MFRFIRSWRNLMSMSRLPLRLEAQYQAGEIRNIQKVHFKKQRIKAKTIFIYMLTAYVGASVFLSIVPELEESEEESEEEAPPLFIPFPGTTKELPPVPYRGSDPEWQEFVKFSKNKKLGEKIREELAAFIQSVAANSSEISKRYGKEMKLRKYWLDIDFPPAPPPEFERKGLEIGDDYISIRSQQVDSLAVFKLRQVLWPSALAQSFWSLAKVLVVDDAKSLAGMLGNRWGPPPHQQSQPGGAQAPQLPTKGNEPTQSPTVPQQPKGLPDSSAEKPAMPGKRPGEEKLGSKATAVDVPISRPMMAFEAKFAQTWRPPRSYPPRGSIIVSGLVELDTPRAWLVFDVRAAYDPKTNAYDPNNTHIALRRAQLKMQAPQR